MPVANWLSQDGKRSHQSSGVSVTGQIFLLGTNQPIREVTDVSPSVPVPVCNSKPCEAWQWMKVEQNLSMPFKSGTVRGKDKRLVRSRPMTLAVGRDDGPKFQSQPLSLSRSSVRSRARNPLLCSSLLVDFLVKNFIVLL